MHSLCKDQKVALSSYTPLTSGQLARDWSVETKHSKTDVIQEKKYGDTEEQDKRIADRLGEVSEKCVPRAQIALAWLLL